MGLGLLGRGIGVTKFLAECGADLIVTDLKTAEQLASSLKQLARYKNIKFILGEHRLEDFRNRDLIIKAAGVPLGSPFITEARKNNIPIEMDASLFAKFAMPAGLKIVGVTGTRGKTTVTMLLAEILKSAFGDKRVHLGGNIRGLTTLPLLKKVKGTLNAKGLASGKGDFVVMELDSWQLQGFGDSKISPSISIFTNLMVDHQNYYANDMDRYFSDKANIFVNQQEDDSLICGKDVLTLIRKKHSSFAKRAIVPDMNVVPKNWKIKLLGEHNRQNIAYAVTVARVLDIKESVIKKVVENYAGVPGRLEFIREVGGVKYYNDTTATTPDGVMAALKALKKYEGKIILLGGGADKELVYDKYAKEVKKSVKALALFKGTATEKILGELKIKNVKLKEEVRTKDFSVIVVDSMPDAFAWAKSQAKHGDIVLLSPGAASFGVFKNEYDRGDQFVGLVKKIRYNFDIR